MDDLSCYALAFLCACDKHLATYETSGYRLFMKFIRIYGWWDAYLKFQNRGSRAHSWSKDS